MCVIPVYYINAPGQTENEYSDMRALALTRLILLKSINTDIVGFTQYAADDATLEQSLDDPSHTSVICLLAANSKFMN